MPWPAVRILLMHSIEDVTARSFPWVTGCLECDIYASVGFYRVTITIKVKLPLPVRFLGIPDVEFECCPSFRGATPQAPDFEPRTRLLRWALGLGVLYAHDCTCIYTYIHLCTYIHIYTHTYKTYIYTYVYIYINIHKPSCSTCKQETRMHVAIGVYLDEEVLGGSPPEPATLNPAKPPLKREQSFEVYCTSRKIRNPQNSIGNSFGAPQKEFLGFRHPESYTFRRREHLHEG